MTERKAFLAVLSIAEDSQRMRFLDQHFPDDKSARLRIMKLVEESNHVDSFLENPAIEELETIANSAGTEQEKDEIHNVKQLQDYLTPSSRPDAIGKLDRYEVLAIIGQGGFGIVLRAFDEMLQRVVAIKVLLPSLAVTSPARKRFIREARASAQIRNGNVVQVYAIEETPLPFIVMEFIPGVTLQKRMDSVGPIPAGESVRIGIQIAKALAAAHEKGLVHRDVKPCNVLLEGGPELQAKLTDFGLARAADDASLTRSGAIAGTPLYMAPEQARGGTLDHRTDLFSLGSTLYCMITGRPPFRAESALAVMGRVCHENPRPIQEIIPETPDWLCKIISKLHEKDPAKRFSSANDVVQALLSGGQKETRTSQTTQTRKNNTRYILLGASLCLLAVTTLLLVLLPSKNKETPPNIIPTQPYGSDSIVKEPKHEKVKPDESNEVATKSALAELLTSSDYEWSKPENLGLKINSPGRDLGPTLTADECTLVYSHQERLCICRRASISEPFSEPVPLPESINSITDGSPTISGDGLCLFFSSNTSGNKPKRMWMSTRNTLNEPFSPPTCCPEPVNSKTWDGIGFITLSGNHLLLTSQRANKPGSGDIWEMTRVGKDKPFTYPKAMPEPVNTRLFDITDWMSDDGTVLLTTTIEGSIQTNHLFIRSTTTKNFGPPLPFKPVRGLNGGRPWLSPDGKRMYFHSRDIPGGSGDLDIWTSQLLAKKRS